MSNATHRYERAHVARARHLRENATDAERRLWSHLRRRALDGVRFRRQVPIGRYIVDFFAPEFGLIVELDGGQHADRQTEDEVRTRWLASRGYHVVRFWNRDVLLNTDGVLTSIQNELRNAQARRPPSLTLPLKGGGDFP
jgi:very-short-patch-repair endonuclease